MGNPGLTTRFSIPVPSFRSAALIVIVYVLSFVAGNAIAPKVYDPNSTFSSVGLPIIEKLGISGQPDDSKSKPLAQRNAKFFEYILHNSRSELIATALGLCLFFVPMIKTSVLGLVCGFLFWHTNDPMLYARLMLPHGVVEMPTIVYVAAVAQSCGWKWLWAGSGKRKREFMNQAGIAGRCFLVAIPLLVIAGIIEAYVT